MNNIKIPSKVTDSIKSSDNSTLHLDLSKKLENQEKKFLFSFALFDREHPLFNLGNNECRSQHIDSEWYVSFLDKLTEVSQENISKLKETVNLHPFDLKKSNVKKSELHSQLEYWQFRIDHKSRVIGVKINNIFYIQWLDPHHNHCDSPGYPGKIYCCKIKSYQERLIQENTELQQALQKEKANTEWCMKEIEKLGQS